MKRPSIASQKKVTPENLAMLGPERLAAILVAVADSRPELKRQLRMELASRHGAEHLTPELDKRLASLAASRARVSWRQRPAFLRDLDALRAVIGEQLGERDPAAAVSRMLNFLDLAPAVSGRMRDRHDELDAIFARAAGDLGALLGAGAAPTADEIATAMAGAPSRWAAWAPAVLAAAPKSLVEDVLALIASRRGPGWPSVVRQVADLAGDIDAWRATFSAEALRSPPLAAELATRLMDGGRLAEAEAVLKDAAPAVGKRRLLGARPAATEPDPDWESAWIRYLDLAGRAAQAQEVRWASFQRTLSVERLKDFTRRLSGFDDVEAEERAFDHVAASPDFPRALAFFMAWPSLPRAAALITARADEAFADAEDAALWAGRLAARWPAAAEILLRKSAAKAFRTRDYAASTRLTEEADALNA